MQKLMLTRCEFFEALVRIANYKYRRQNSSRQNASTMLTQTSKLNRNSTTADTNISYAEAFQNLIEQCILQSYNIEIWNDFREFQLWTIEISDLFKLNLEAIKRVTARYVNPRERAFSKKNALSLFCKDSNIALAEVDFTTCYGLSKMTIVQEHLMKDEYERYYKLRTVEFLDLIGRVADVKYKEIMGLTLYDKIVFVLESLFALNNEEVQLPD